MPPPQESDLPPVPDDEAPTQVSTQLPWSQIPKFVPGTTNVQEYTQKLKFLAALWPTDFLDQLAPRAALLVEGTAFKKIARIPPQKLKVKSTDGIAAIVEAIGGSWGSTELEGRYEFFEKSLYGEQFNAMTSPTTVFCQGWKPILLSSLLATQHWRGGSGLCSLASVDAQCG